MRVLFWQEPFWPQVGGMTIVADLLLHDLHARGYTFEMVAANDFPFWEVLREGNVDRIVVVQQKITALKRRFAPDLVHLSGIGPSVLFHWQTVKSAPVPTLLTLHSSNTLSGIENSLPRRTLEEAAWVAGCSASILEEARHLVPSIRSRSSVIYNGVRRPATAPAPLPETPVLLCVGYLAEHKGFDLAIGALTILRAAIPNLRLLIAGDGPDRRSLERQAAAAGVESAVSFLGTVAHDRIYEVINDATIVLMPSRRESFGLVAVEAALMRRVVVATRVGGLPEVISHRETGVLIDEQSAEALAGAVRDLLADPHTLERMGVAAERRASDCFSAARHADAYDRLYQRVVSNGVSNRGAVSRQ